jgi:phage tail-like protein
MSVPDLNFRYLNRDGRWLDFTWDGLELSADGTLTLASLPMLTGDLPASLATMADPSGPAGIADDGEGIVYFSLPDENLVNGVEACEPLAAPRGLAIPHRRRALFICDSGNHRIVILDPATSEVLEIWDGFDVPVAIAADPAGTIFVADRGSKRITKYSLRGDADGAFADTVAASGLIVDPVSIAADTGHVYVLDATQLVFVFDHAGNPVPGPAAWSPLTRPMGLAVTPDSIYVGDNALRRVLRFRNASGFPFVGEALGYEGPVAALAIARNGDLLVHTGAAITPIALKMTGAFTTTGLLFSKALHAGAGQVAWHSLHATIDELPAHGHIQFFFRTNDNPAHLPFPSPDWTAAPRDVTDLYLGGPHARFLWIVSSFTADGLGSPTLTELKARFDQNTYFPLLPALYNYPTPSREFFGRLLALFESFNVEDEDAIARLPELFDPSAIPPEALQWLASWLAADLDQHWSVAKQRQAIAQAYARDARRGTIAGLLEAIAFETGQTVRIEEPIQDTSRWALPAAAPCGLVVPEGTGAQNESMLGIGTALAGPSPDGAVIGSTAILDRSRILNAEDFGLPLFDEVAHRFCVFLYRGAQSAQAQAIAKVVDREKPAHTSYHLCTIEPRMRVGFQARVGIDTVVGGPPEPSPLGDAASAGGLALSSANGIRIGVHSRIGDRLRI